MSLTKNISFTFSAQIINTIIGFIISIFITRILGADGRGDNAIFTNSLSFSVLFFGFSISSTIPYYLNNKKTNPNELLSTILVYIILSTSIVFIVLNLLDYKHLLELALPLNMSGLKYKLIFTGFYFFSILNSVFTTYLTTYKKFKEYALISLLMQIIPLFIYGLIYFKIIHIEKSKAFETVFYLTFIFCILSIIVTSIIFVKLLKIIPSKRLLEKGLIIQFILFSAMPYIGNVATFFNYKLDFWVVDAYCGKHQLGIYSLASQLAQLLWILPQAISSVLYSYASSATLQDALKFTIQLKQIALVGTLILAILGAVLSHYFITFIYGKEFISVTNLILIFMIGVVPFSIPTILSSLFASQGNFKISLYISLITLVFSIIMYFTLIPKYGIIGGAIASSIAYFIASILSEIWFCKTYKVNFNNLFIVDKKIIYKIKNYIIKNK